MYRNLPLLTGFLIVLLTGSARSQPTPLPNIIILFADDLGYGDLGPYGNTVHRTPHLDRMAREGVRFTDFYVTSGVCTPSRSSLMTGCYAQRVDMHVNARPWGEVGRQVLFPKARKGLNPSETTLAELLKSKGYATACIGKWHLGDQLQFLPTRQGFDEYFGIPYSNDMHRDDAPLPLMRGEKVIEAPVEQSTLTRRYTEEVLSFIKKNKDQPFFVYLPHAMTHNPLHASDGFRGKSKNGIYGDAVEEIDWSTGQILNYLRESGLDKNTLVLFSSDNGAAGRWGGTNVPLSGWKGSTMEGGMRVPGIFWWPGTLRPRVVQGSMATTMDLFPTLAALIDSPLPTDRPLDGHDILPLLKGDTDQSPYDAFYYYQLEQLQAVRVGPWKLHLPLDSMYQNIHSGEITAGRPAALYNVVTDVAETENLLEKYPDIVRRLTAVAETARETLGDWGRKGRDVRPAALEPNPVARLK